MNVAGERKKTDQIFADYLFMRPIKKLDKKYEKSDN